jgi:hypothetical protein
MPRGSCRTSLPRRRRSRRHADQGRVLAEEDRDAVESGACPDDPAGCTAGRAAPAGSRAPGAAAPASHRLTGSDLQGTSASRSEAAWSMPCTPAGSARGRLAGGLDPRGATRRVKRDAVGGGRPVYTTALDAARAELAAHERSSRSSAVAGLDVAAEVVAHLACRTGRVHARRAARASGAARRSTRGKRQ